MKIKALAVLSASLFLSYCSGDSVSNMDLLENDQALGLRAINDPYGVFGTKSEASLFNDEKIEGINKEEVAYNDPYAITEDAALTTGLTAIAADCDVYTVTFRWGQLRGFTHDNDAELTWSGNIHTNTGTLAVVKTLAFDDRDYVLPRTDPKQVDFVSFQRPHYDGLKVKYAVCPSDVAALPIGEVPTLTFSSPEVPFTKTYTATELRTLREIVDIDDQDNHFMARSFLRSDLCQGTINGQWEKVVDHYAMFRGEVVASNGIKLGHLKGVSNQFTETDKRWAAKFIRNNGNYVAYMTGTFDDSHFSGDIFKSDNRSDDRGDIEGSYVKIGPGMRTFSGTYILDCADVPVDDVP